MEGVGAAASLITIIALVKETTAICMKYGSDVKNAPESVSLLLDELKALELICGRLLQIGQDATIEQASQGYFLRELLNSTGLLTTYRKQLSKLKRKLDGDNGLSGGLAARLAFPMRQKGISEIMRTIHTIREILQAALCLDDSRYLRSTYTEMIHIASSLKIDKVANLPAQAQPRDVQAPSLNLSEFTSGGKHHSRNSKPPTNIAALEHKHFAFSSPIGTFHVQRWRALVTKQDPDKSSEANGKSSILVRFTPSTILIRCLVQLYVEWKLSANTWLLPRLEIHFAPVLDHDHNIFLASRTGGIEMLKELISCDPGLVGCVNSDGWTPLHYAAAGGHTAICKLLVDNGAASNQIGIKNLSPLHVAAHFGHVETFQSLVLAGWDPDDSHQHGQNAVFDILAHENNTNTSTREGLIKWLIFGQESFKINMCAKDNSGRDISHHFFFANQIEPVIACSIEAKKTPFHLYMIEKCEYMDQLDCFGMSLIHYACQLGDDELLRLLARTGWDINSLSSQGRSPIYYAIKHGHYEIAETLVSLGADVDAGIYDVDENDIDDIWVTEQPPLVLAANNGRLDLVQLLQETTTRGNNTPIIPIAFNYAVRRGYHDIVRYFINTVPEQLKPQTAMCFAVDSTPDLIESLVAVGASVDEVTDGWIPICLAACIGSANAVQNLIQLGADVNQPGNRLTALQFAAIEGNETIVDLLLEAGANVRLTGSCSLLPATLAENHCHWKLALKLASIYDQEQREHSHNIIDRAINQSTTKLVDMASNTDNTNINWKRSCDIACAIANNDQSLFKKLMANTFDVDFRASHTWTPLTIAIKHQRWDMVRDLLYAGAEVSLVPRVDDDAHSPDMPFHDAVTAGNSEIVKLMLKYGARVDLCDDTGETPLIRSLSLFWAFILLQKHSRHLINSSIVRLLVEAGSDVNMTCALGQSPLGMAAAVGDTQSVAILIAAGADINRKSVGNLDETTRCKPQIRDHRSPMEWAALNGHTDVVQLLFEAGAEWKKLKKDPALGYAHRILMHSWFTEARELPKKADCADVLSDASISATNESRKSFQESELPGEAGCVTITSSLTTKDISIKEHMNTATSVSKRALSHRGITGATKAFFIGLILSLTVVFVLSLRLCLRTLADIRSTKVAARAYYIFFGIILYACLQLLFK